MKKQLIVTNEVALEARRRQAEAGKPRPVIYSVYIQMLNEALESGIEVKYVERGRIEGTAIKLDIPLEVFEKIEAIKKTLDANRVPGEKVVSKTGIILSLLIAYVNKIKVNQR